MPESGMMAPVSGSHLESAAKASRVGRSNLSEEEKLFNQVVQEIEDRQQFLAKMADLGDHSHDERVNKEIEERIRDMDTLNKLIEDNKKQRKQRMK